MRSLIAIAALVFLASCSDTPSKPTTSGGSSSGSGKIVTATPDETFECDDDLILEPHLPEECIPPEPPEPVKPAEPPEPDPIVGVYRCYSTKIKDEGLMRVYANGEVDPVSMDVERWQRDGNAYHFYGDDFTVDATTKKLRHLQGVKIWSTKYSSDDGEPNLTAYDYDQDNPYRAVECLKKSDDPDHLFEAYQLRGTSDQSGLRMWACNNVGRKGTLDGEIWSRIFLQSGWADSLAECEALCEEKIRGRNNGFTCPQDRR